MIQFGDNFRCPNTIFFSYIFFPCYLFSYNFVTQHLEIMVEGHSRIDFQLARSHTLKMTTDQFGQRISLSKRNLSIISRTLNLHSPDQKPPQPKPELIAVEGHSSIDFQLARQLILGKQVWGPHPPFINENVYVGVLATPTRVFYFFFTLILGKQAWGLGLGALGSGIGSR